MCFFRVEFSVFVEHQSHKFFRYKNDHTKSLKTVYDSMLVISGKVEVFELLNGLGYEVVDITRVTD